MAGGDEGDDASPVWRTLKRLGLVGGALSFVVAVFAFWDTVCERAPELARLVPFTQCRAKSAARPQVPVVVVPGFPAAVPTGPVPRKVIYDQQNAQLVKAMQDGDIEFITSLRDGGFRLRREDACGHMNSFAIEVQLKGISVSATPLMLSLIEKPLACRGAFFSYEDSGKENADLDSFLIDAALGRSMVGCDGSTKEQPKHWAADVSVIDAVVSTWGRSPTFAQTARRYLAAIDAVQKASRESKIAACMTVANNGIKTHSPAIERAMDKCLSFSSVRVPGSVTQSNREKCAWVAPDTVIASSVYLADLKRWAK